MVILQKNNLKRIFAEADRRRGDTGEIFVGLLECRLDAVVYRSKFVPTIFSARQFVNHGHVTVNGKKVNIPSFMVKVGDVIEIREKSRQIPMVIQGIQSTERDYPEYISMENDGTKATFLRIPTLGRNSICGCDGTKPSGGILLTLRTIIYYKKSRSKYFERLFNCVGYIFYNNLLFKIIIFLFLLDKPRHDMND